MMTAMTTMTTIATGQTNLHICLMKNCGYLRGTNLTQITIFFLNTEYNTTHKLSINSLIKENRKINRTVFHILKKYIQKKKK